MVEFIPIYVNIYYDFSNKCLSKSNQYRQNTCFFPLCKLYDKSSNLEIRPRTNNQLNLLIKNIKKIAQKNKHICLANTQEEEFYLLPRYRT